MKKLTRDEMKNVVGGISLAAECYVHTDDWSSQISCSGPSDCKKKLAGTSGSWKWCCASCP